MRDHVIVCGHRNFNSTKHCVIACNWSLNASEFCKITVGEWINGITYEHKLEEKTKCKKKKKKKKKNESQFSYAQCDMISTETKTSSTHPFIDRLWSDFRMHENLSRKQRKEQTEKADVPPVTRLAWRARSADREKEMTKMRK